MLPLLVRIFDVDFYISPPVQNLDVTFSQFRGSAVHQVPVIRIFGSTENGEKICIHVHGVFPYFYVPYDGTEVANGLMYKIASNIDRAINISLGQASSNNQHVYKISLVSGVPFYGYHSKKHQFLKVYLYNPIFIKRVNNLLFNESVLGKLYQPHETHLNFTLQFMIDYNLHGMSNIILSEVTYRHEAGANESEGFHEKVSCCALECDTLGEFILNRQEIESGNLAANPGIAALWEDEKQRRRNKNEDSQLPHYLSLDKTNVPPTESHELFKRALRERLAVLSDEQEEKRELNLTVYPAECPISKRLLNCSFVDFHSPQSSQSNESMDYDLDQTITDTMNITLDEDVQELVDVLKDLEKNVDVEEDSILSQVSRYEEEVDDPDISISLDVTRNLLDETMMLSQLCGIEEKLNENDEKTSEFHETQTIKIPQLDGNCRDMADLCSLYSEDFPKKAKGRIKRANKIRKHKLPLTWQPTPDILVTANPFAIDHVIPQVKQTQTNRNSSKKKSFPDLKKFSRPLITHVPVKTRMSFQTIQSLLDKEYCYFCAETIGQRVAKKNQWKRMKIYLKQLLEATSDEKNNKSREIPSSSGNDFLDEKYTSNFRYNNNITKVKEPSSKNSMKRIRSMERAEYLLRKQKKLKRLAKEIASKSQKCLKMLEAYSKPIFKIVPGYRPYYYEKRPRIEDSSTNTSKTSKVLDKIPTKLFPLKSLSQVLKDQKDNEMKFYNAMNSFNENTWMFEKKFPERSTSKEEISEDEVEQAKPYLFLDGANDSSSDDDEKVLKKMGKPPEKSKLSYSSLPISKQSTGHVELGNLMPLTRKDNTKTKTHDVAQSSYWTTVACDNVQKIKRKINFETTFVEEKLSCKLENSRKPDNLFDANLQNSSKKKRTNKLYHVSEENNFDVEYQDTLVVEKNTIEDTEEVIHRIDGRVEVDDKLPVSTIYDLLNNFQPQPSTSKCDIDVEFTKASDTSDDFSKIDRSLRTPDIIHEEISSDSKDVSSSETSNSRSNEINEKVDGISYIGNDPHFNDNFVQSGSSSDVPCAQNEGKQVLTPEDDLSGSKNLIYYKPQYRPPTKKDIEKNMHEFGIPKVKAKEPFFSNPDDSSGGLEVGYSVLKIKTMTTADLTDFDSSFIGMESYRTENFSKIPKSGKARYSHCKESHCVIMPIKKPPTWEAVTKWLIGKSIKSDVCEKSVVSKKKVYLLQNEEGCSDDSFDLSLTLTPSTPKDDNITVLGTPSSRESTCAPDSKESSFNSDATLTPTSSRSRATSPTVSKRRRKKKVNRSLLLRKSLRLSHSTEHSGIISGVSLNNTYGFENSVRNYQNARPSIKHENLTIFAMELHVNTRGDFKPNPQYDAIQALFYSISNDVEDGSSKPRKSEGLFVVKQSENQVDSKIYFLKGAFSACDVTCVENELDLFKEFTKFVIYWDPDILIGYEIQMLSWGFLIERCFHLGINIIPDLSRVKDKHLKFNDKETGDLRVTGRVVLDFWRLLRHEIALQSYTLQSTVYEILQERIPKYSFKDLTLWWSHQTDLFRHRTIDYYLTYVRSTLKLVDQLDLVGRTSELARLFGIQFYEVLSRGSQFRVESMMLRLAKPLNYVAVSPSVQQRAKMKAPEHIALVLEPESKLYTDPVIVLDFQSLYPSIIIAYNYCFSTCIGKVELLGKTGPFEFGATNLKISRGRLKYLLKRNNLNFSPCGVGFVKKTMRDGIMPRMLREILDTRLMVKKSMKENKDDALLQKVLHNRQLGLKLIANVTYGYTAANFSGRMPAVELGDSIVSKARETLQRTIALVDSNKEWGVRVVYGDTDSLFVHCPGKTRSEAFIIGEEIVEMVGRENPDPVKLKLEKVYQPCILQTKKRYVGYMYESPDQKHPVYNAKGIETVRRDGCPAVSKMLEKCLRLLFETKDVSRVKEYCLKQFNKIILGRISIQDLTFAKEFRGLTGYRPGACVPSLELAKKWVAIDKRAEPRRGERVPYVIVNGPPGLPLIRLVRSPYDVLNDPALRPNALYYITRVIIPPLNRCFNLIGADLHQWFHQMPRKQLQYLPSATSPLKKSTISQYFASTLCAVCSAQTQNGLCEECINKPQETVVKLNERTRHWEAAYNNCKLLCSTCTQIIDDPKCISLDCPALYRLYHTEKDLQQAQHIRDLLSQNFDLS